MSAVSTEVASSSNNNSLVPNKRRVAYYYDEEIGNFYYSQGHPMKPHRIRMAHALVVNYGLYKKMEIYRPYTLSSEEMTLFHADDYVHFLQHVNPDNQKDFNREISRYNVDVDCPVFDGLFNFCQLSAGGSVGGAYKLNHRTADIVVNWAGGLHHAKKSEASGFCYINDIVLSILELLKCHNRVLYIDIDIHHGDGVEEAFYTTDRVMTLSFHKYGEYFPGTGDLKDIGVNKGENYSLNFPLQDGINDESYRSIFEPIVQKVMEVFQPGAVVLQCGADSLAGDRLGCFNLSVQGHARCVQFIRSFNLPTLVLGGGGYTIRNVARCWANETAVCVGEALPQDIPFNEYYEYYGPNYKLMVEETNMENMNTPESLDKTKIKLFEILRQLPHAPSVQFHQPVPELSQPPERESDPDVRMSEADRDRMVSHEGEYYDEDKDVDMALAPSATLVTPAESDAINTAESKKRKRDAPSISAPLKKASTSSSTPTLTSMPNEANAMPPLVTSTATGDVADDKDKDNNNSNDLSAGATASSDCPPLPDLTTFIQNPSDSAQPPSSESPPLAPSDQAAGAPAPASTNTSE